MAIIPNDYRVCEKCGGKRFKKETTFKLPLKSTQLSDSQQAYTSDTKFSYVCADCNTDAMITMHNYK